MVKNCQGGSPFDQLSLFLPWTKNQIQDIIFNLMIEFRGMEESSIMKMSGSRVRTIIGQLKTYKKNNPQIVCPLIKRKK